MSRLFFWKNGNTVPITVSVDSPMTDADYVSEVIVLADGNPNAGIATFHFTPGSGVAEARIGRRRRRRRRAHVGCAP
jgi:sulfur-oxidizing protein SoxY